MIQTSNSILPDCNTHLLQVCAALELYVPVEYSSGSLSQLRSLIVIPCRWLCSDLESCAHAGLNVVLGG